MVRSPLAFENVTFFYESATAAVFHELTVQFPIGWTGVIGPNGAGKTTLLRLACGQLAPLAGAVRAPAEVIYCPQRTDEPPPRLAGFLAAAEGPACALRGQLGIGDDWPGRWDTLSHGERKRAQIAVALWREPLVLAVDEPTNHIDRDARRQLAAALAGFRGVGLLVSHDRELLDGLCGQTLFIEPPGAVLRPGGYSKAVELAEADRLAAARRRQQARREVNKLAEEAAERGREAAASHRKRSKRGLAIKDHDARNRKNQARVTGKDGAAGRQLRQLDGRIRHAAERLDAAYVRKQYAMGISIGGERARRARLVRLPAGSIPLGEGRRLEFPELILTPDDRIALIGPNGGGKSTLVRHLMANLDLPPDKVVYLSQEIDRREAVAALEQVRSLPNRRLGAVMTAVSCLGSRPQRLLETEQPSPGEIRKILLALGLSADPWLIVMDEPTNHLDLPSIECLEEALAACPCALLLVSHDVRFLQRLTNRTWRLEEDPATRNTMRLLTSESSL